MKILVLSSHTPSLFWFRIDMMKSFLSLGHEVVAVGNEDEIVWKEKFSALNIKYRQIYVERTGTNPLKDLKTWKSIKRVVLEEKPHKIFSYQAKTVVYGGFVARKYKEIDYYALIAGCGSAFLAKGIKARLLRFVLKIEYKIGLRKAKKVFFQNTDDIRLFLAHRMVEGKNIIVINGSGVNLEKFRSQPLPKKFAFLCICRLIRDKGVVEYLEAAKRVKKIYPNIRFLLVGPYDSNPSALKKEDLQLYMDNDIVEYFGEQSDVVPFIAQCNVYVLPSYREGTPKSVLEAMASCRAIITTDAPGCRETVIDGVNGYLVPVKNVEKLVEKMLYFIESPEKVFEMAQNGRHIAEEKFDVEKINKMIIKSMEL